jgi:hypothetical protein
MLCLNLSAEITFENSRNWLFNIFVFSSLFLFNQLIINVLSLIFLPYFIQRTVLFFSFRGTFVLPHTRRRWAFVCGLLAAALCSVKCSFFFFFFNT